MGVGDAIHLNARYHLTDIGVTQGLYRGYIGFYGKHEAEAWGLWGIGIILGDVGCIWGVEKEMETLVPTLKLLRRQGNIVVEEDAEMYAWATAFDQLRLAFCMRGADYCAVTACHSSKDYTNNNGRHARWL